MFKSIPKMAVAALAIIAMHGATQAQEISFDQISKPLRQWDGELRFPSNALELDDSDYWLNANRYSSFILDGMAEPRLFDQVRAEGDWTIRLSVLPSFSTTLTGRIEANPNTSTLIYKVGNSGAWGPVTAYDETRAELDKAALAKVIAQIESSMICSRGYSETVGFDGSKWILEYKDAEQYCAYMEWSPSGGIFHEVFSVIHLAIGKNKAEIEELLTYY